MTPRSIPSISSSTRPVISSSSLPAARTSPPMPCVRTTTPKPSSLSCPSSPPPSVPDLLLRCRSTTGSMATSQKLSPPPSPIRIHHCNRCSRRAWAPAPPSSSSLPTTALFIPTNAPIVQGEPYFGTKWAPVLEAYGLVKGAEGKPFYATNEAEQRTYRGLLNADGSLSQITTVRRAGWRKPGPGRRRQRLSSRRPDLCLLPRGQAPG